ncbi:hypothetical protein CBOM_03518 [Ceraceosorus bombacis]|uniref:Uncharacterized protein n=1 Tax=Ceraceosorus bombacis TaxID=401625 RepID=A0A0P1BGY7_9BASI|nr:hypothetical protein CBOM_03518 [Ceraceosorus bombacis]
MSKEHCRKMKDMDKSTPRDMEYGAKRLEGKVMRLQGELNAQKADFDQQTQELDATRQDMIKLKGLHANKERQSRTAHNVELEELDGENTLL